MSNPVDPGNEGEIIGTISNSDNPEQVIAIRYMRDEGAFATSGIQSCLGMPEILIPVHMVAADFELIGNIIAAILEKISSAHETDRVFEYASGFEVLDRRYTLTEHGEFMKLEEA